MTVYVLEMFDELADLLEETNPNVARIPNPVTWDMKKAYLNAGIRAMWPRVYRVAQDDAIALVGGTNEYTMPAALRGGRLIYVEGKTNATDAVFQFMPDSLYTIIPGPDRADIFRLKGDVEGTGLDGGGLRITSAVPLSPVAAVDAGAAATEEYTGADFTIEAPVLYAMNRITIRGLHNRLDFTRLSVQQQNRAAVPNELMSASIFWLDEFERRINEWQLVHPSSVA
jgi:hypothetical protein